MAGSARSLSRKDLLRRLEKRPPSGAYAFCGPEEFLKQEARQAMKGALLGAAAQGMGGRYGTLSFRIGETESAEILSAASQAGLFGAESLLWVEGFERLTRARGKEREAWQEVLAGQPPNPVILVSGLTSRELGKKSKFLATLLRSVTVVDFWALKPLEAVNWVIESAKKNGLQISRSAAQQIVHHAGADLLGLSKEIEKISLLHGEGSLGVSDLREMVRSGLIGSAWDCVEAALAGRVNEALEGLQAVRRAETAFSFTWKLSYAATRALAGGQRESHGGAWSDRQGRGGGGGTKQSEVRRKNLLGRLVYECYEWERHLKRGVWAGAYDYHALEGLMIAHAARVQGPRRS